MMNNRKFLYYTVFLFAFLIHANGYAQSRDTIQKIEAKSFEKIMQNTPEGVVIDARTEKEFEAGHVKDAANFNVLSPQEFEEQIQTLDKSKPVFVYCQSGKRSAVAASKLKAAGFSQIYELEGGFNAWKKFSLKESVDRATNLTQKQFASLLTIDKPVLVLFVKENCAPCSQRENTLKSIKNKKKDNVEVVTINVDKNPALASSLFAGETPVLHLYKNKNLVWVTTDGFSSKEVLKKL